MYGYLNNGDLCWAPNPIQIETNRIWNPTDAQYETVGYKRVVFTDSPETEEGYHAEQNWEERETEIVEVWIIVEDPDEVDEAEAFDIIFGGE